ERTPFMPRPTIQGSAPRHVLCCLILCNFAQIPVIDRILACQESLLGCFSIFKVARKHLLSFRVLLCRQRGNVEIVSQLVSRNFTFVLSIADNDSVSFIFDHAKRLSRKKADYAIFGRRRDVLNRIQHASRSCCGAALAGPVAFGGCCSSNWRSSCCWNVI